MESFTLTRTQLLLTRVFSTAKFETFSSVHNQGWKPWSTQQTDKFAMITRANLCRLARCANGCQQIHSGKSPNSSLHKICEGPASWRTEQLNTYSCSEKIHTHTHKERKNTSGFDPFRVCFTKQKNLNWPGSIGQKPEVNRGNYRYKMQFGLKHTVSKLGLGPYINIFNKHASTHSPCVHNLTYMYVLQNILKSVEHVRWRRPHL